MSNRISKYIMEPWRIPICLQEKGFGRLIPDSIYLRCAFRNSMGYSLNLRNPQTFNEKMQWLKLHDRKPVYTKMVDKYEAKTFATDIIGEQYIIPTIGVWDAVEEVDFQSLPNQFVLKCTHDSGGIVICKDKAELDIVGAKKKLKACLENKYYLKGREWSYKNVKPRIIAEQYLSDEFGEELKDYKIWCFNGTPYMTLVCRDRYQEVGLKEDFYDNDWNHLELERPLHANSKEPTSQPENFSLMKDLSSKLAMNTYFSRIDFYEVNHKLFFGEITFYPASGFEGFCPMAWDLKLGQMIQLS